MAKQGLERVVSHWHKLIENFQTSSLEFYTSVEEALEQRKLVDLETRRVDYDEGGVLSPRREYFRIKGDRHTFDICAAPFGSGFVFSSWMTKPKARWVILYYLGFALLTVVIWALLQFLLRPGNLVSIAGLGFLFSVFVSPFVLLPLAFLIVLSLIAVAARSGNLGPEAAILTVPLVGAFYARVFAPETYYRLDTMLMFQSAVHAAMMEVINGLLVQKGLRALGEDEQKPIFRELVGGDGRSKQQLPLERVSVGGGR